MKVRPPRVLVGRVLAGAWRETPLPLDVSADELTRVRPLLHRTGAAALAWWRLRGTALAGTAPGLPWRTDCRPSRQVLDQGALPRLPGPRGHDDRELRERLLDDRL